MTHSASCPDTDAYGLTGLRRYRRTPHGLVLQVEYVGEVYAGPGMHWCCMWRDATTDDLCGETIIST